jgi:hypothetical protein
MQPAALSSHCILQCRRCRCVQLCSLHLSPAGERDLRGERAVHVEAAHSEKPNLQYACNLRGKIDCSGWKQIEHGARFAGNSISCGSSLRYLSSQPAWYEIEKKCTQFDRQEFAIFHLLGGNIKWRDIPKITKIKLHEYENKFSVRAGCVHNRWYGYIPQEIVGHFMLLNSDRSHFM